MKQKDGAEISISIAPLTHDSNKIIVSISNFDGSVFK